MVQTNERGEMAGQVCMVTGATSGIGLATARALAEKGATLVLVGRNPTQGARRVEQIRQASGNSELEFMLADLSAQAEIRRLAERFRARFARLDVLVNNVGGFFIRRRLSVDGVEMTWALNYLGPFLLTHLLLERLRASAPARVINVSSDMHRRAEIHFGNLGLEGAYNVLEAYGQSKLALVSFTFELARRQEGHGVTANGLHPGFVATEMWKKGDPLRRILGPILMPLIRMVAKSPQEGAETSVYLAASPAVADVTGAYFVDQRAVRAAPAAYDREKARRLWEISAEMTGVAPYRSQRASSGSNAS